MTTKYNATLNVQLIEVRALDSTPDGYLTGGPFQVLLELFDTHSTKNQSIWKTKSELHSNIQKPPIVWKQHFHVTTLPGLELDHHAHAEHASNGTNGTNGTSQPHFKLEVILCKQKGNKWTKACASIPLDDVVINKPEEEKVIELENHQAAVVLKMSLVNTSVPTDNAKSLKQLQANGSLMKHSDSSGNLIYNYSSFSVKYWTQPGEVVCIVGSIPKLGNWNPQKAQKMNWNEGGLWSLDFSWRKSEIPFEYKYIVLNTTTKEVRWEMTPNRVFNVQPNQLQTTRNEAWEVV